MKNGWKKKFKKCNNYFINKNIFCLGIEKKNNILIRCKKRFYKVYR